MKSGALCTNIPFYTTPPTCAITIDVLQKLLNIRIQILDQLETDIQKKDDKHMNLKTILINHENEIGWSNVEYDISSHYVLSNAFCKTDQDRNWFSNLESKLFLLRIEMYNIDIIEVLKKLNIPLEKQDNINENLLDKIKFRDNMNSQIYRIPFEFALNLLPSMMYFLNEGYIYITKNELGQIVETVFRESILKRLSIMNKNISRLMSDRRISNLIKEIEQRREVEVLTNSNKININTNLTSKDIDGLAEKTFPLCMQLLNRNVTNNSHLKHFGRLQYGLFLKSLGLSLEESLSFWKNKFKNISHEKFEKEYSYNIRHSYGKEGKRNDYIPWSCSKIQKLQAPSSGEFHGCPYQVYTDDNLKNILLSMNFKEIDVLKILDKKRNHEYSVACMKYFEAKYPGHLFEKVGVQPVGFHDSAMKILKDSNKTKISYEK